MQPINPDPFSSSRRRPRIDSFSSPCSSPTEAPKRPRVSEQMASAKSRGKLPQTVRAVDLTRTKKTAFQPYAGARKLVISNLRAPAAQDARLAEYYAATEKQLADALDAILSARAVDVPFERLYRGVEDVCRKGNPEKVLMLLKDKVERHLDKTVLPRIHASGGKTPVDYLRTVLAEWGAWNRQMVLIRSTFSFLDRTYLLKEGLSSINDLTISQFRRAIFPSNEVQYQNSVGRVCVMGACHLINHDRRCTEHVDPELLRVAIRMMYVLGVYVKCFESPFLQHSAAYFTGFGEAWSVTGLKDYITVLTRLLKSEQRRVLVYSMEMTTEKQLMQSAHAILINQYAAKLLQTDNLHKLLDDKDVASMKALYDLLRLSSIELKLKEPWGNYIKQTGTNIIRDKEHGDDMVIRLLELRRSLDIMIRDAFSRDDDLQWSMRDAFGKVMNDRIVASCWNSGTSKVGEMTAKHIDMLLRGGLKTLPKSLLSDTQDRARAERRGQSTTADEDAELDRQLDQALELFRFIEGKDAFEAFYKQGLAKRLLMGRSASKDAERSMLAKLRSECGSNFTHNLEHMFKDQDIGKEEMESYKQHCKAAGKRAPVDLDVMVLSAAAWPTYPDSRLRLPGEVDEQLKDFETHYQSMHTGRVLNWKHSLAHCSVEARFAKGKKELLVSAFQAVVLLLFNDVSDDGFLSHSQIGEATGLSGGDLDRTLQSLACGKARVLTKHPKGRDVSSTDTFSFNDKFRDDRYRVKINQIQLRETKEETKATYERVVQDRRFETQAAIVRIMKSRKSMGHAELVAEAINMTKNRGSVEPAAIKMEIESLIEKDYMEREGNLYVYMA